MGVENKYVLIVHNTPHNLSKHGIGHYDEKTRQHLRIDNSHVTVVLIILLLMLYKASMPPMIQSQMLLS